MDAKAYLEHIVEPTVQEYAVDPTSIRRAFLACIATYHTVDYLAKPRSPGNLRKTLRDECPSFGQIDEVAHAFKHVISSKSHLGVESVISRPPATWNRAQWDLSRWDDETGGVTLNGNSDLDLLTELNSAVSHLRSCLSEQQ